MFLLALIYVSLPQHLISKNTTVIYNTELKIKSYTDVFINKFTSTHLVDRNKLLTYNKDLLLFLQFLLFQTSMSFCETTGAIGVQKEKYYYVAFLRITTLYYERWS